MALKKLVHIMLVVLAMMVVTSVMMVMLKTVMIYHTCQSTETCRLHHHKLPWSRISVFISSSICISIFFYISQLFLLDSWAMGRGILPTLEILHVSVLLSI